MPSAIKRRTVLRLASAATIFSMLHWPQRVAAARTVRAGGTGSATELLDRISQALKKLHSDLELTVVPGLGSSGGLLATRDNALEFAVISRRLKPDEAALLDDIAIARTPFALATSRPNPENLASTAIAGYFSEAAAKWPDGSPVRIVLRPRADSDNQLIGRLFPGVGDAIEQARKRPDVPIAVNDQDNATMAEALPGSLAGISLVQLQLERRGLRALTIDGKAPTLDNLENGSYPYGRELYLAASKKPTAAVQAVVAFLRSKDGADLLRACGCLQIA